MRLNCTPLPCSSGWRISASTFVFQALAKQVARRVVRVVVDVVANRELRAGGGPLGDRRLEHADVLEQEPRAAAEEFVVERAVVLLPEHAGEELGVELAQRRFDAEPRIGLGDRRVDRGARGCGCADDGAAQIAQHLRIGERQLNRFLERDVPVLGRAWGGDRPRMGRGERFVGVHRGAGGLGRVLDFRRDLLVGAGRGTCFEVAARSATGSRRAQEERQRAARPRISACCPWRVRFGMSASAPIEWIARFAVRVAPGAVADCNAGKVRRRDTTSVDERGKDTGNCGRRTGQHLVAKSSVGSTSVAVVEIAASTIFGVDDRRGAYSRGSQRGESC